jgi:hypothetical protein
MTDEQDYGPNVSRYVKAFGRIKAKITELNTEIKALEAQQDLIKDALLAELHARELTSMGTPFGMVKRTQTCRWYTTDINECRSWVIANSCPELFESRLHQGNTEAWLAENPTNPPPGLSAQSKQSISITVKG